MVGLAAILFSARCLTIADNARFSSFWSVLFLAIGVTSGLTVELTRVTASNRRPVASSDEKGLRVRVLLVTVMVGTAVVLGGSMPAWRLAVPGFAGAQSWLMGLALVIGITGFAGQCVLIGSLAGLGHWRVYAVVVAMESGVRLVLVSLSAVFQAGLAPFMFAAILGEYAWIVVVAVSRTARQALAQRVDTTALALARRVGLAMLGLAASTVLLVGFPWLIGLTTDRAVYLAAAPLLVAVSLTRAPLMVPISSLYSVAISYFASRHDPPARVIRAMLLAVALVGLVGVALAWAVGPWLLGLVRAEYVLPGSTLAGLTAGAACIAMITVSGMLCQSQDRYGSHISGWTVAVVVSVVILLIPMGLVVRVIWALVAGPLCGLVVHLFLLNRQQSAPAS